MLVYRNATHFSVNFATCNFIKFIDEPLSKQYGIDIKIETQINGTR